ncbi:Mini-ribonuclease 3 [Gorillibacterium massiliense]|uniref:Mini-ribonuclease 3 n=1 Tax=Gorillibacterium massiliense TaxID=1280390 RepID=UPI0004B70CB0|nr:Mini-ribonuclease 3 [Gorillibacterium massiliense]
MTDSDNLSLFFFAPAKEPKLMNPLALAYIGDAVYDLFIRQYVTSQPNHRPNHLHREATRFVSAKAQAKALASIMPLLNEEELDIVRRGRNAKSGTVPKNTDVQVYRHGTAFECLIGFLYYRKEFARLQEIMMASLDPVSISSEQSGQKVPEETGENE